MSCMIAQVMDKDENAWPEWLTVAEDIDIPYWVGLTLQLAAGVLLVCA